MASTDDVSRSRAKLERCPPGHNGRDVALSELAEALRDRFRREHNIDDLNGAITLYRDALKLRPTGNHKRPISLIHLAACLSKRYENQGASADLEEAVTLGRAALELRPPGHPYRAFSLYNLACDLKKRFQKLNDMRDLDEAIELHRVALELRPSGHLHRSSSLHELAICLSNRHDKQGVVADLEEAITLGRAALELRPPGHPHRGILLHNLACDLRTRFQKQANARDLEEAIELHRAALELRPTGHPRRSASLHQLAVCLSSRYDNQGTTADLEEAVTLGRAALDLRPPGHPYRAAALHNLACDFRKQFQKEADMHHLEEAIELLRAALELRPSGHPNRSSSLHALALCLSDRHDNQGAAADLEEAVTLGHAALELCSPGHPDRVVVLYNLACDLLKKFRKQADMPATSSLHRATSVVCPTGMADVASSLSELSLHLWDRFQKQATTSDLDDAICLATYALELRLPRRSHHDIPVGAWIQGLAQGTNSDGQVILGREVDNLRDLASYHRARFQRQDTFVDLNAAIELYRSVLQFHPTGHPSRASSLHDLAQCLADRFRQPLATSDLDEAIALEQEALQLLIPGDPSYDMSRCSLTAYLQMKIGAQGAIASSNPPSVAHFDIEQVIRNVAFDTLKAMPPRLLHTYTGILCNREAQVSHFMASQQYNQLLSSCATCDPAQQMKLIHTVVSKYFQFVMLSHRWGEGEPLLHDVEGHPIYGMSTRGGLGKLQTFCLVACERDYLWAWSDTCCIDKESSAELQEAIGSMFAWYRRSALTIVYLSDVPDTDSFGNSEWFQRGWTLQELLASERVLFYTLNWTLYKNLTSSNHKADDAVLEELERATGIESRFLTSFSPSMEDARSRLQWASLRRTTRPEDIAYSLFGIFNLHLPVLYGEPAENALGRLLAEIVSQSGDTSVLDWVGEASPYHSCFPAQITSYQMLPSLPLHPDTEEHVTMRERPASLPTALRTLYRSLDKSPLPRFLNRRLTLPCIAYPVTAVRLKGTAPKYTYEIQASGLRALEITLPSELENEILLQGGLQLVRPWHSKLLGPSTGLHTTLEEQLLLALGRPFNALLLTGLPHSEYKRMASSTLITAQPADLTSILQSEIRTFDIV